MPIRFDTLGKFARACAPFPRGPRPADAGEAVRVLAEAEAEAREGGVSAAIAEVKEAVLGPAPFDDETAVAVATASGLARRQAQRARMPEAVKAFFDVCARKPFMDVFCDCSDPLKSVQDKDAEKALLSCGVHMVIEEQRTGGDFSALVAFLAGTVSRRRAGATDVDLAGIAAALFEGRLTVVGPGVAIANRRRP